MYGLPQAGIPAQKLLEQRLNEKGYSQRSLNPSYCKHDWRPISFTLFVNDFGVKYLVKEHAKNLVTTINEHYIISQD